MGGASHRDAYAYVLAQLKVCNGLIRSLTQGPKKLRKVYLQDAEGTGLLLEKAGEPGGYRGCEVRSYPRRPEGIHRILRHDGSRSHDEHAVRIRMHGSCNKALHGISEV